MDIDGHSQETESIEISPLIDVVFILLIFFMVTTTFVKDYEVDIDRPGAQSAKMSGGQSIKISIDKDSNITVDGEPTKIWVLQSKIRDQLSFGKSKSVLVVADESVSTKNLLEVVDQAKLAGAKDVGVATQLEMGAGV